MYQTHAFEDKQPNKPEQQYKKSNSARFVRETKVNLQCGKRYGIATDQSIVIISLPHHLSQAPGKDWPAGRDAPQFELFPSNSNKKAEYARVADGHGTEAASCATRLASTCPRIDKEEKNVRAISQIIGTKIGKTFAR